jgi:phytoene dehydrogenase-like protein
VNELTEKPDSDVVIIGAGHNGLVAAGYLTRAGYSVTVLERRHIVGGAATTEEFHPGFHNSVCSYVVSLLNPVVVEDLELEHYGLEIMDRADCTLQPGREARSGCFFPGDPEAFMAVVAGLSEQDAAVFGRFQTVLEMAADMLRSMVLETPPNSGGLPDLMRAGKSADRLRKIGPEMQAEFMKIMTMSVAEYLDEWFESDDLKSLYSQQAFVGNMVSPYSAGSAYVLIHHFFGEVNGKVGAWGHAKGGMGAITQAMARSAEAHGANIEVSAPVEAVMIESGVATGVRLKVGREIRGRLVAANTNPKLLFSELVPDAAVPAQFKRRMENFRCHSGTLRINLALDGLPQFTCLNHLPQAEQEQRLQGLILFNGNWQYCENAYHEARTRGWSSHPIIEMYMPTTIDDTLAPAGKHVVSLFCQHFAFDLPDGRNWDEEKQVAADTVIDFIAEFCPGLRELLLGVQVLSPLDLEREFGLIGGDIMHGVLSMDQMYSMRPVAGHADYRMPVKNLYLCGSGAHPGGGVSGNPGRNAAREMIKDLKRR